MKTVSLFDDKITPTKPIKQVYLPRVPSADDIQSVSRATVIKELKKEIKSKNLAPEKAANSLTAAEKVVLERVQASFNDFLTHYKTGVVNLLGGAYRYIVSVNGLIIAEDRLPKNMAAIVSEKLQQQGFVGSKEEEWLPQLVEQSPNALGRLLADVLKGGPIKIESLINQNYSNLSLPSAVEWKLISKTINWDSFRLGPYDGSTTRPFKVFLNDGSYNNCTTRAWNGNFGDSASSQYSRRYSDADFYLPLIHAPSETKDSAFATFCWLIEHGFLSYSALNEIGDSLDWSALYSHDDNTVYLSSVKKASQNGKSTALSKELNQASTDEEDNPISAEQAMGWFCSSDYRRSDAEAYVDSLLTDSKQGHWDLADESVSRSGISVKLDTPVYARNPWVDVQSNSLIGIDFGTKSTVVSKLGEIGDISIVAVGGSGAEPDDDSNENPTILQLANFEQFIKSYKSSRGRPETTWLDVSSSWLAKRDLDESSAVNFYSFITTLKQWAAAKDQWLYLKSANKADGEISIKPFLQLSDDEFNPIEAYAYYVGLAINNMRDKAIYPHYLMSFPVNYSEAVVEKIIQSFKKGLLRSLPNVLARDASFIEQFNVEKYASEPAAYAVCALQTYGFDPQSEEEKTYYGIFDFGGGTTDFDYGVWRGANDEEYEAGNYSYVVEHFNASGDQYLGGENILANMAFKVFSDANNQQALRRKAIKFTHSLEIKDDIPGSRDNIDNTSQWALLNMYKMQEALRPIWHNDAKVSELFPNSKVEITLFDQQGNQVSDCDIQIDIDALRNYIRARIERGVVNFFEGMQQEISNLQSVEKMNIFLAGNSCKSQWVKEIFAEQCQAFCNKHNKEEEFFDIYPALGSKECFELLERNKTPYEKDNPFFPTGKTGVAVGLIMTRPGSDVLVKGIRESGEEGGFQFTVGREQRNAFNPLITLNSEIDHQWQPFGGKALNKVAEILYSSDPSAVGGKVALTECTRVRINWSKNYPQNYIGIRAAAVDSIEIAILTEEQDVIESQTIDLK